VRRINQYLNPRLVDICQRAVKIEELNSKLYSYLPSSLKEHCQVGSFNGGCLVIVTKDVVWAAELRYCLPELRDTLRKEAGIYQLTSIKIAVAIPETSYSSKTRNRTSSLSAKARETIISCGDQCRYEPLKLALQKLGGKEE